MNITRFKQIIDFQEPLLCILGDVFKTPVDHIAFAVNYPNSAGEYNNSDTGFAADVCKRYWPELKKIEFKKGEIRSHRFMGKTYHAMAVHTNESYGWQDSPHLIELCLNKLPVSSEEVIAVILIGGGVSGNKWKASVNNIVGMSKSYKTIVLYIKEIEYYKIILDTGLAYATIPLNFLPKTKKYRAIEAT